MSIPVDVADLAGPSRASAPGYLLTASGDRRGEGR